MKIKKSGLKKIIKEVLDEITEKPPFDIEDKVQDKKTKKIGVITGIYKFNKWATAPWIRWEGSKSSVVHNWYDIDHSLRN